MAHVSKSGSAPLLVGIALAAILVVPTVTRAVDCTPQYVQLTEDPASKVLVGCCNANGTWKTGTSSQRACLNPNNMCQKGHCDGTAGSTCNASYNNAPGTCVVQDGQYCKLGECQQQLCTANSDPELIPLRCDDANDCKADGCSGSTYFTPSCTHTNVSNGAECVYPDADPCTAGLCTDGTCGSVVDDGAFCGTASGDTCTPAFCDANGDCISQGETIQCTGTLQTCRKWQCSWDGQTSSCAQVKVDSANPAENSCDTDPHDCKIQTCGPKGRCGSSPQPVGTSCDTNYTAPLTDCYSGQCDARKNCENETLGVYGFYDGVPCGPQDSNVCTSQTCQGLTCGVVTCASNTCIACGVSGVCGGTPPNNCACVAP